MIRYGNRPRHNYIAGAPAPAEEKPDMSRVHARQAPAGRSQRQALAEAEAPEAASAALAPRQGVKP